MSGVSLFILAIGLAMDAFVVSITSGICIREVKFKYATKIGLCFGFFQGFMPVLGFLLGENFSKYIESFDHWIAFTLLAFLGGKMLFEAIRSEKDEQDQCKRDILCTKTLLVMGIATSIDALAVGISFAFLKVNIAYASIVIGVITFLTSTLGVYVGRKFGDRFKKNAEIAGGIILVGIGLKILLEHLSIL